MKYISLIISIILLSTNIILAQKSQVFEIKKSHTIKASDIKQGYNAQIIHLEAPVPGGDSYRGFLREQKKLVRATYPLKIGEQQKNKSLTPAPIINKSVGKTRKLPNGNVLPITGGIPNDNTLAVSKDEILISGINSVIYAYDLKKDSSLFPTQMVALENIANGGRFENFYDPKLMYDVEEDRFILTFLGNNRPENSKVMMAFSVTNNPLDGWHVYTIPGNPLDNNRWTDYPAISLTSNELFYTANLIIPDVSWQLGFDGSVIWQIDKKAGYNGEATLPTKLWSDIKYENRFLRNLHPVVGASGITEDVYFISNRNFDISNDSVFLVKLNGDINDANANLEIKMAKSDLAYGLAPNGRQENTPANDPTTGLDINDSRVLGAFIESGNIQFVNTSVNPETGLSAIYHGFIENLEDDSPLVKGKIIGHPSLDLAYPNIAWTGNQPCEAQAIIGFNFTSPTDYAGIGSVFFSNDSAHSDIIRLKDGENYVDRLSGAYDRWGDYFGIQRLHHDPKRVVTGGFYGLQNKVSGTWFNVLTSPDTNIFNVDIETYGVAGQCKAIVEVKVNGGKEPYTYNWISHPTNSGNKLNNLCFGDTVIVEVKDARECAKTDTISLQVKPTLNNPVVYPNPFVDIVSVQFTLEKDAIVRAEIYNMKGQLIDLVAKRRAKKGLNELSFDTYPLSIGNYFIRIIADDKEVLSQKIQKVKP
jgi:hypothetical protein